MQMHDALYDAHELLRKIAHHETSKDKGILEADHDFIAIVNQAADATQAAYNMAHDKGLDREELEPK